jgi:hypothetical protein
MWLPKFYLKLKNLRQTYKVSQVMSAHAPIAMVEENKVMSQLKNI